MAFQVFESDKALNSASIASFYSSLSAGVEFSRACLTEGLSDVVTGILMMFPIKYFATLELGQ